MRIPHQQLSSAVLRAVVEEFVTRDGTDNSGVEQRICSVLQQLETNTVELHFDPESVTCTIRPLSDSES
ncbi:MAG: YheU family protein [Planctomycetes bacterium]|nr:YheU family protein [Planctomycetota bacterium]